MFIRIQQLKRTDGIGSKKHGGAMTTIAGRPTGSSGSIEEQLLSGSFINGKRFNALFYPVVFCLVSNVQFSPGLWISGRY
ncbi:MAG: hypothetical protein ABIX01_15595 [Chitinophagaceae bacterium]